MGTAADTWRKVTELVRIIDFPVTRTYPYGWWFHVITVLLYLGLIPVISVWSAATAGYFTVTDLSPVYYSRFERMWYSRFVPDSWFRPQESTCNEVLIAPGQSFYTSNAILKWEIQSIQLEEGSSADVVPYTGQNLTDCYPVEVQVQLSRAEQYIRYQIYATCFSNPNLPWGMRIVTTQDILLQMWYIPEWAGTGRNKKADAISDMGNLMNSRLIEMFKVLRGVYLWNAANDTADVQQYFAHFWDSRCPTYDDINLNDTTRDCLSQPFTAWMELMTLNDIYPAADETPHQDFGVGVVQALFSMAAWDLGHSEGNNVFTNRTAWDDMVKRINFTNYLELVNVTAVEAITTFPDLNKSTAPVIPNQYVCQKLQTKTPAMYAGSVLGLIFALLGGFFAIWHTFWQIWGRLVWKRFKATPDNKDAFDPLPTTPSVSHGASTAIGLQPIHGPIANP